MKAFFFQGTLQLFILPATRLAWNFLVNEEYVLTLICWLTLQNANRLRDSWFWFQSKSAHLGSKTQEMQRNSVKCSAMSLLKYSYRMTEQGLPWQDLACCLSSGIATIVEGVFKKKCKEGLGGRLPLVFRRICATNSIFLKSSLL